jgi:hypothetical protein
MKGQKWQKRSKNMQKMTKERKRYEDNSGWIVFEVSTE